MSDINILPGIGLLLVSLWLVIFGASLMLVFLAIAGLTQKALPFRGRAGFFLFQGTIPAFLLGWVGILLASYGPRDLKTSLDTASPEGSILICSLLFALGIAWGVRRYSNSRR